MDKHPATGLEEAGGLSHGALDVEDLDVLPVLLEERDEEVDRELVRGRVRVRVGLG